MEIQNLVVALELWGCIIALVFMIATFIMGRANQKQNGRLAGLMLIVALLLLSDAVLTRHEGMDSTVTIAICYIFAFLEFLLGYAIICEFIAFTYTTLEKYGATGLKPFLLVAHAFQAIAAILLVVSQWTGWLYYFDENHYYVAGDLFLLSPICGIISIMICFVMVIVHRACVRKRTIFLICTLIVIACIGGILEAYCEKIPFINIGIAIDSMLLFIGLEIENSRIMREQQRRLHAVQMETVLSQVEPRYIVECLDKIKEQCSSDSEQTKELIESLSVYIRANLMATSLQKCVPFEEELAFIKSYIALEQARYGVEISAEYDIEVVDFELPALILQPIVENAIKHGIVPKQAGTIKVATKATDEEIVLTVSDDGEGYDLKAKPLPCEKIKTGIVNTKDLLAAMCGGSLEIESAPGVGTSVIIRIPKSGE